MRPLRPDRAEHVAEVLRREPDVAGDGHGLQPQFCRGAGAVDVHGVKVVATKVDGADAGALRNAVDQLKDKLKSAVVVLASVESPSKVVLVAGVTGDQVTRVKAGELVGAIAAQIGGRGGGRPDFAQAGGNNPAALDAALASVPELVKYTLALLMPESPEIFSASSTWFLIR